MATSSPTGEAAHVADHALARLIADTMRQTGATYSSIARKGGMPRQTVAAIAQRKLVTTPRPDTLEKLAKGLGLSFATVASHASLAVSQTFQDTQWATIQEDPLLMVLMDKASSLDEQGRVVLLQTAKALLGEVPAADNSA